MIEATRFNGTKILLNPDLIVYVETIPDTVVTMTNGEKVYVREPSSEIARQYLEHKKQVFARTIEGELPVKKE